MRPDTCHETSYLPEFLLLGWECGPAGKCPAKQQVLQPQYACESDCSQVCALLALFTPSPE